MKRISDYRRVRSVILCFLLAAWCAPAVCAAAEEGVDAAIASDELHEQLWQVMEDAGRNLELRVEPVMEQLAAESDPLVLEQALLSLDAMTFSLVIMQTQMWSEDESAVLRAAIASSDLLYSTLADSLADDRSFVELVFGREDWQRLQAAGVEEVFGDVESMTLGTEMLSPVLATVSPEQAAQLLSELTSEPRYEHLAEALSELVGSGWMHELVDLPPGWARERVEAGDTFWLPLLVAEGGVDDSALLMEQMAGLPVEQQLRLVAQHPDPGFLPMLADFQHAFLDALGCPECQPGFGKRGQIQAQVMALASMNMPETIAMLHELVGDVPEAWRTDLGTVAVHGLFLHDSPQARAGLMTLLENDIDIPLNVWQLGMLKDVGDERLRRVVEARIPGMVDTLLADSSGDEHAAWSWCETAPLLLYAYDRDWSNAWSEVQGQLPDDEGFRQQLANCAWGFYDVAGRSESGRGLRAVLGLWEQLPVETDKYEMLIRWALNADAGDVEARRVILLEWVSGRPLWDELQPRLQDRLLGLPDFGASSCEAPDDWQAEVESSDEGET